MDLKGTTSIRNVVAKARLRGRIPESRDAEIYQLVIDGMRDLSLFHLPHKNMIKCKFDDLGRVYFPKDYLMFLAVGVPINGRLCTFTRDNALTSTSDQTYYYEDFDKEYGEDANAEKGGIGYGYGGSGNVRYYIDDKRRFIQSTDFKGKKATLHYVSNGIAENPKEALIPTIAEEALIAYVLWMYVAYDMEVNLYERRERERIYGEKLADLNLTQCPTMDEIATAFYEGLHQSIKRF